MRCALSHSSLPAFVIRQGTGLAAPVCGGIYFGGINPEQNATISNSEFDGNWAFSDAGGIYRAGNDQSWGGQLVILNSTFHHNSAHYGGGLALSALSRNTLRHVTLADNDADYGSSIYAAGLAVTHFYSSIIAHDKRNEMCYGSLSVNSRSLIEDGSCSPALKGVARLSLLVEPGDDSPAYYPLLPSSAAIDAVECHAASLPTKSERRVHRADYAI